MTCEMKSIWNSPWPTQMPVTPSLPKRPGLGFWDNVLTSAGGIQTVYLIALRTTTAAPGREAAVFVSRRAANAREVCGGVPVTPRPVRRRAQRSSPI
jgi:hypothetical protein